MRNVHNSAVVVPFQAGACVYPADAISEQVYLVCNPGEDARCDTRWSRRFRHKAPSSECTGSGANAAANIRLAVN